MRFATLPLLLVVVASAPGAAQGRPAAGCTPGDGGITLSRGFCATVFADSLPGPRHLVVAANGDVFVALRGVRGQGGGLVALRDRDGDGRADTTVRLGSSAATEAVLFDGHLYSENGASILRWRIPAGALAPTGGPDTIVAGLPVGGHAAKTFAIARDGSMYVNIGSLTNACQQRDRTPGSAGNEPCTELETRAGIWRFDARKVGQRQADGTHWARGIRNAVGIALDRQGRLWAAQHGRDQLSANWPARFDTAYNAENPAEELFLVRRGDDFGWPYCYYSTARDARVLAPEYGGDGEQVARCDQTRAAVAHFPAHWAPNGLLFHSGRGVPARYRNGVFIAFHGSWNRAPLPQAGYNVTFQPLDATGRAQRGRETFANGFATNLNVARSVDNRRPTGLAEGPDGAIYITDDATGRIWKVRYVGR